MAAAPNLPPMDDPEPQQITISNTGVLSPATCTIANGQQVEFINDLSYTINITFEADAQGVTVFSSPVAVAGNGGIATISPQTNNRTVNYNTDGSQNFPYAIQVGNGPLYISVVTNSTGGVDVTPSPAIIPANGTWQLYKASGDNNTYNVSWPNVSAPPFPNFTVNNTTQTASTTTSNYVAYKVQRPTPTESTGSGGGTIKVGGN
ncbi:MAG: hypothetical protein WAK13_02280 [Terriglobales bacterium]